jgi:hypothetical protein
VRVHVFRLLSTHKGNATTPEGKCDANGRNENRQFIVHGRQFPRFCGLPVRG